jgi:hypothetical protein
MTVFFAIGFFQGTFDEVLRHYVMDRHKFFNWKIKSRLMQWIVYLTGTFFIFSLPLSWLAFWKNAPEWSIFYTPVWLVAVIAGTLICRGLLKPS